MLVVDGLSLVSSSTWFKVAYTGVDGCNLYLVGAIRISKEKGTNQKLRLFNRGKTISGAIY